MVKAHSLIELIIMLVTVDIRIGMAFECPWKQEMISNILKSSLLLVLLLVIQEPAKLL